MNTIIDSDNIHQGQPVLTRGPDLTTAKGTLIMLHGRGSSAESILSLYEDIDLNSLSAIAPQATHGSWYPQSFLAPIAANQPYLDSALSRIDDLVEGLLSNGIKSEKIAFLGFSQGACLTTEYVARHPRKYGAVLALTGGLIGPLGSTFDYSGSLAGTPVFLGTSNPDLHVPFARVQETEKVLTKMGGSVSLVRYQGMPHTICEDEIEKCRSLLKKMIER